MDKRALLLTRPLARAQRFAAQLSEAARARAEICISPLLEIVPTGLAPDLHGFSGVIFTSAHAVSLAPRLPGGLAYCVGAQTAQAAEALGWRVQITEQTADKLITAMRASDLRGPLAHLAGTHRRGEIAQHLGQSGVQVEVITLYDQRLQPLSPDAQTLLAGEAAVIVPLFSPRTAQQFVDQATCLNAAIVIAISPAVAEVVKDHSVWRTHVVQAPTGPEMVQMVEMLLRSDSLA